MESKQLLFREVTQDVYSSPLFPSHCMPLIDERQAGECSLQRVCGKMGTTFRPLADRESYYKREA